MGRLPGFPFDTQEFRERWTAYRKGIEAGKWPKPDAAHFCALNGICLEELVRAAKDERGVQNGLCREIKRFLTWLQGQYMTNPCWSGPNTGKAIFGLKQDLGGYVYSDRQDIKTDGKVAVSVSFGGDSDAFK